MKNVITTLKTTGLSICAIASISVISTVTSPVWADSISHVPGSACQAYDEGALSSRQLTRSTTGIYNKSNKTISVYCPVDTSNIGNGLLTVSIQAKSTDYNDYGYTGVDVLYLKGLNCYLAKDYGRQRTYTSFRSWIGGNGVTRINRSSSNPVVVKCNLPTNYKIESIRAK